MVCETCQEISLQVSELKEVILQLADRFDRQEAYIQKIAHRIEDFLASKNMNCNTAEDDTDRYEILKNPNSHLARRKPVTPQRRANTPGSYAVTSTSSPSPNNTSNFIMLDKRKPLAPRYNLNGLNSSVNSSIFPKSSEYMSSSTGLNHSSGISEQPKTVKASNVDSPISHSSPPSEDGYTGVECNGIMMDDNTSDFGSLGSSSLRIKEEMIDCSEYDTESKGNGTMNESFSTSRPSSVVNTSSIMTEDDMMRQIDEEHDDDDGPVLNSEASDIVANHHSIAAYLTSHTNPKRESTALNNNNPYLSAMSANAMILNQLYHPQMVESAMRGMGPPPLHSAKPPNTPPFTSVEAMARQIETVQPVNSTGEIKPPQPPPSSMMNSSFNLADFNNAVSSRALQDSLKGLLTTPNGSMHSHLNQSPIAAKSRKFPNVNNNMLSQSPDRFGLSSMGGGPMIGKPGPKRSRTSSAASDRNEKGNFVCELCSSKFLWRGTWKRHMMTVHSKIRYKCTQCGFTSSRKDYLYVHIRSNACAKRKDGTTPNATTTVGPLGETKLSPGDSLTGSPSGTALHAMAAFGSSTPTGASLTTSMPSMAVLSG